MTIRNTGDEPLTLTGLSTPLPMMPEIHKTRTDAEGFSSITSTGEITIAPGESVTLEPGGLHAMVMQLQTPMTEGETFSLMLLFEDGGEATELPLVARSLVGASGHMVFEKFLSEPAEVYERCGQSTTAW